MFYVFVLLFVYFLFCYFSFPVASSFTLSVFIFLKEERGHGESGRLGATRAGSDPPVVILIIKLSPHYKSLMTRLRFIKLILTRLQSVSHVARKATRQVPPPLVELAALCCTFRFLKCVAPDARPTSGRAASGSGGTGGTSLRGKRHDLQDRQRRPRPVGRQLLVGDASSLRAATPSCGFSRSSTHRAPWGVAPATPRTNWCVSCAAALSSPSSSSSLWALTKLALSCGFSRRSTHPAPWGVAPATPRTDRCVCCAAAQSCPSDGH